MPDPLSLEDVRHVARLARLQLAPDEIDRCRAELSGILAHVAKISELDVTDVEPMAHPLDMTNRFDEDLVTPPMPVDDVLAIAPEVEGPYLAVPKVLGDGGGA